uniref:non-specific serine/threonine protein kinase n=1 Tax=Geotrypetes seraphini TaxID=260995 RepID=A0A6P8S9Y8_GEOSA|nr:testis-specific serine/threonine-protein kinase 3-like [Geotrypetes seraphini]
MSITSGLIKGGSKVVPGITPLDSTFSFSVALQVSVPPFSIVGCTGADKLCNSSGVRGEIGSTTGGINSGASCAANIAPNTVPGRGRTPGPIGLSEVSPSKIEVCPPRSADTPAPTGTAKLVIAVCVDGEEAEKVGRTPLCLPLRFGIVKAEKRRQTASPAQSAPSGPAQNKRRGNMEHRLTLDKHGYDFCRVIGRGSYSTVNRAFSHKLGKFVVIKIIDKSQSAPDYISKFLPRELSILTQCSHPNIVQIYEIIEASNGLVFIVMEEALSDLFELIDSKDYLVEDEARHIFMQIVQAVMYCHGQGIAHRDLKCENILMTSENTPKLTDFGFATCINRSSLSSTYCGSTAYAAPEILQGQPYDAFKADIWSLGVVLYLMVTGYMPFDDNDLTKLLQLQQQPLEFPSSHSLSIFCKDIISSMLSRNPQKRISINNLLEHPWLCYP